MNNDEIKKVLINKMPIVYNGVIYPYAQAWRCCVDKYGKFISSLELVAYNRCLVVARADECQAVGLTNQTEGENT